MNANKTLAPNDEERGQPHVPSRASLARSSSSVSFAFAPQGDVVLSSMRSQKPQSDLEKFRQFVDAHVPGGTSEVSDADLANLRVLVDPSARPEVAVGLIQEMDTLLGSDDKRLEQWMAESMATGIRFDSIDKARSHLRQFRALLASNLARGSSGEHGRTSGSSQ